MDAPLVITGMHRSGTTLLTKLLRERGVFFGAHLESNLEDFFFLRRNEWLLRRAGGAWERPAPIVEFLEDSRLRAEAQALFADHVHSFAFRRFTGLANYLRSGGRCADGKPWGWKDPRAVFTFPVWEEVFPEARLIYVRRNGVDVAASLRKRDLARRQEEAPSKSSLFIRTLLGRARNAWQSIEFYDHYFFASRDLTLSAGFELWEQYVERGEKIFADYSGPKLALCFEDLVENPEPSLRDLAAFAGLEDIDAALASWSETMRPGRAGAFREDPELRTFYETVRTTRWMRDLGYGEMLDS